MIAASEAKLLTEKANKEKTGVNLKRVEMIILERANYGLSNLQIDLQHESYLRDNISEVTNALQRFGYAVTVDSGYDQRDRIGWNYLNISW
jgi:ABC-type metal ion transport system substrate-binding protein